MPVITKANHAHFRALASQAIAKRKQAQEEAQSLARALLEKDPNAQALSARLERQSALLDRLIVNQLAKPPGEKVSPALLERLLKAQGVLLAQVRSVRDKAEQEPGKGAKRRMLEPVKRLAGQEPELVRDVLSRAMAAPAKPPVLAILPSTGQAPLPQDEACPPPSPGLPGAGQVEDPAELLQ